MPDELCSLGRGGTPLSGAALSRVRPRLQVIRVGGDHAVQGAGLSVPAEATARPGAGPRRTVPWALSGSRVSFRPRKTAATAASAARKPGRFHSSGQAALVDGSGRADWLAASWGSCGKRNAKTQDQRGGSPTQSGSKVRWQLVERLHDFRLQHDHDRALWIVGRHLQLQRQHFAGPGVQGVGVELGR
jgi:hypothetical protein